MSLMFALLACGSGKIDVGDSASEDRSGSWSGVVEGFAAFEDGWEDEPYCAGDLHAEADAGGSIRGSGSCVILWGPYIDEVFDASLSGSVGADGAFSVELGLEYATEERSWERATITGELDPGLSGQGDSSYSPAGLEPIEGLLGL